MTTRGITPAHVAFAAWAALIALQFAWYFWLAPPVNGGAGLALALTLPPLLLPLLLLRRSVDRALLVLGMVCLGYFSLGIVAAWSEPTARVPALIEIALCVTIFAALAVQTVIEKRARRQKAST